MKQDIQDRIEEIIDAASVKGRNQLYEDEVYRILDLIDIRTPVHRRVADETAVSRDML